MLLIVLTLLAIATVPVAGGRLLRLVEVRIVALWALALAVLLQVLVLGVLSQWPEPVLAAGHLGSYVSAGVFAWRNRRIPGLWLIALGGGANFAAIAANGGVMPVHPRALEIAGIADSTVHFENSVVVEGAPLWFLGDVFAVPASWPLANVFSVGDVLILAGVFWFAHRVSGSRFVRREDQPPGAGSTPGGAASGVAGRSS